jgi:hypothetical protein
VIFFPGFRVAPPIQLEGSLIELAPGRGRPFVSELGLCFAKVQSLEVAGLWVGFCGGGTPVGGGPEA